MTTYKTVADMAREMHLDIFGAFHSTPNDGVPESIRTLLLLGPMEPGFWPFITSQPEFADKQPDAIDRWSRRAIGKMACDLGGKSYFPFGGPPWHPFIAWAKKTGRAWQSEITILVHDTAGLMVSYRGALGLREQLELPTSQRQRPCDSCPDKPCLTACPVAALTPKGYDVPCCKGFLGSTDGADCLTAGCKVRRSCPVSKSYGRHPAQSSYHMGYFNR